MRTRLDTRMVELGLAGSREKAKRLILAGVVRVDGQRGDKPSDLVSEQSTVEVDAPEKFVSRGGHKLEAALETFQINCAGKICLDVGASTGGFTDCLLQRGAKKVHAVDVGKGQLDWRLRQKPNVIVHDGVNARSITRETTGEPVDLATVDVSFISLRLVLPAVIKLLKPAGWLVALIKPQFEVGRKFVKKGGVVRDLAVHDKVKADLTSFAVGQLGLELVGVIESPLLGPAGNKEFLMALRKP